LSPKQRKRGARRSARRRQKEAAIAPGAVLAIDVAESCALWRHDLPDVDELCSVAAQAALGAADALGRPVELGIVLGDDALLRSLNGRWRGLDKATNVLSFASDATEALPPDAPRLLGDVVLAFETVHAEAAGQGKPLAHHLGHLVVHGVLHLLGFDHETMAEAERMEALETAVLAQLGVPDPYGPHGTTDD
jgi:probable rRNA maturation factor